ncbi:MAG: hypothetical protein QG613_1108, partial [Pseudomonadota bacterium]|nr:hypothetical protein [Pseudomonadota bacterium]
IAGDDHQIGIAMVCVDIGNRRFQLLFRVTAMQVAALCGQMEVGELNQFHMYPRFHYRRAIACQYRYADWRRMSGAATFARHAGSCT